MSIRSCVHWAAICLLILATPRARSADEAVVNRAIARGVDHLKRSQNKEGLWTRQLNGTIGATALAGLALLECEVSEDDPAIAKATEALRDGSIPLTDTYSIALSIMFFDRLGDAGDVPLIESLTVRLLAGQTADGGWTYECPAIGEAELSRLRNLLKQRAAHGRKRETTERKRTVHDLPLPIQQQLLVAEQLKPGAAASTASDNSNTQFATLALWVGHRYGVPVEKALARLEARFRNTQNADGGWDYSGGPASATTPAMTCAGLLGLAVVYGVTNDAILDRNSAKSVKDSPRLSKPRAARDPARDRAVRAGLLAVGAMIGQSQTGAVVDAGPLRSFPNYYFLWSLERVAMVFGLQTIGNRDWYSWGAEFALARQQKDGSWDGGYAEGGADTSFALLFLRRSNLAPDLTASLRGKVQDPTEVALRARGMSSGLAKGNTQPAGEPAQESDGAKAGKNLGPKLPLPDPLAPGEGRASRPSETSPTEREAARLSAELVRAAPAERDALLKKLAQGKGVVHTQALAAAIPRLTGHSKTKARDALAERIARMTVATLKDKLQDEDLEIRRAAALACAMKEEKALIPSLIQLLEDPEPLVIRAGHVALKALTGQDFGPESDASQAERATAVAAWKSWWKKQGGSVIATDRPSSDDASSDQEKLQGTWVLIALEQQGKSVPREQLGNLRMIFNGDRISFEYPDHTEAGIYKLEPTKELKTIDVVTASTTSKGIYRLEVDTLKICGVSAGEERPAEFATKPGTKQVLFVLKRQSP